MMDDSVSQGRTGEEFERMMRLEENADLHSRLSVCESSNVALSRRITTLEEHTRGRHNDDPFESMMPMVWVMIALTLAPIVIDLVKQWKSAS